MVDVLRPDLCVLGAGAGGSAAAAAAAAVGAKVVIVAAPPRVSGAASTHFLLAAMRRGGGSREARGSNTSEAVEVWNEVRARVARDVARVCPRFPLARLRAMNVTVVSGTGRFVGKRAVDVGNVRIEARRFIVATGSAPIVPRISGLELVQWHTPDTIGLLDRPPSRLVVVGSDVEAVELGQAFRRAGSSVTVLAESPLLGDFDTEISSPVINALAAEGVEVIQADIQSIEPAGVGLRLHLSNGVVEGSHLLFCAGRKPHVEGLGLESAGVRFAPVGIEVRADLRTTNRRIYAIGAVAGASSVQAATYQAGLAVRRALFRLPVRQRPDLVPEVVFTDPEVAVCGLSEAEARARHRKVRVLRASLGETERSILDDLGAGHIKVVTNASGRILGAAIVGPSAGELIAIWQAAISKGMAIADLDQVVFPRLTLSDAARQVVLAGLSPRLRSPWVARALAVARWLG